MCRSGIYTGGGVGVSIESEGLVLALEWWVKNFPRSLRHHDFFKNKLITSVPLPPISEDNLPSGGSSIT